MTSATMKPARNAGGGYAEGRGLGLVILAAVILAVTGFFNLLDGIAAIANSHIFIGNAHYVVGDLRLWGWVMTIFGAVQLLAVFGVWAGNQLARWFAVAVVGLNAIGQMFNAHKEQTPLVFYSYRTDQSRRSGRDGFEEVLNQEQMVQPITKYTWLARRPDMIPETIRRAFKAAWTPPYGPSYISWHSDYNEM